jgi:indolepyruvate ferredoxin oxidoreductase beta subunit
LITPEAVAHEALPHKRTLNVALLGALSAHLSLSEELWLASLRSAFDQAFFEGNKKAFLIGRRAQSAQG